MWSPPWQSWEQIRSAADAAREARHHRGYPLPAGPVVLSALAARWAFVEDQPIHSKLTRCLGKISKVDGLANVAVHTQLVAANNVALFIGGSENDHGKHFGSVTGA